MAKRNRDIPTNERYRVTNQPGSVDNRSTLFSVTEGLFLLVWMTGIVNSSQVDQGRGGGACHGLLVAEASLCKRKIYMYKIQVNGGKRKVKEKYIFVIYIVHGM